MMPKFAFYIMMVLLAQCAVAKGPNLVWFTEDYPPFNYHVNGQVEGIAIQALKLVYRDLGWKFDDNEVMLLPWPRAYQMTLSNNNACIFSMTYTEERARLFQFIGPTMDNHVAIIGHKETDYHLPNLRSIGDLKIGVVKNDIGHQLLRQLGVDKESLVFLASGFELVQMLKLKRIDLIAYGDVIARYQFKRAGINPKHYRIVMPLRSSYLGFACNKAIDKRIIDKMNDALKVIRGRQPEIFDPEYFYSQTE
ncbi:transporter substrate-binding domain-containing protein [Pseudoalteromonas luteoviolacea]|uniref:substrate-binding periplasmic protein n=1 Tax=Pseudoalteromonas luteoviolacea TaxID=43657 RepID=UPI001F2AA933|nr:transporter substrate-binding domain-containing protein [Pseudoalteromonas luteoviolacea]MCF6441285.1 transporter substrate-binding domain-containing protein [Pseudoalteromonas luteoviolacea]